MAGGVVIAGIVILTVLAAVELVYIFTVPPDSYSESDTFTVLVYRREDKDFCRFLKAFIRQRYWMDTGIFRRIYVVHMDVPEEMSGDVRTVCRKRQDIVYCSGREFLELIADKKNSAENSCISSDKIV